MRPSKISPETYRLADTRTRIDENPVIIKVRRPSDKTFTAQYRVGITISNNIPNRAVTSGSSSYSTEATLLAMPGTDIRAGDRFHDEHGQGYMVRMVIPGQRWQVEAQVVIEASAKFAP